MGTGGAQSPGEEGRASLPAAGRPLATSLPAQAQHVAPAGPHQSRPAAMPLEPRGLPGRPPGPLRRWTLTLDSMSEQWPFLPHLGRQTCSCGPLRWQRQVPPTTGAHASCPPSQHSSVLTVSPCHPLCWAWSLPSSPRGCSVPRAVAGPWPPSPPAQTLTPAWGQAASGAGQPCGSAARHVGCTIELPLNSLFATGTDSTKLTRPGWGGDSAARAGGGALSSKHTETRTGAGQSKRRG